jgi:hypothetical protein
VSRLVAGGIAFGALLVLTAAGALLVASQSARDGGDAAGSVSEPRIRGLPASAVLPGQWPFDAEHALLEELLVGDFFPLLIAVCILEDVQGHVSYEQYEADRARFGATAENPLHGRLIGQAMEKCSIPQRD